MKIQFPASDALIKVGKGALIAAVGAALTYISEAASGLSFGEFTPVVVVGWSVFANFVRKSLGL